MLFREDIYSRLERFRSQLDKAARNPRLISLKNAEDLWSHDDVIFYVASVDPTGKAAKYVSWILDMVLSGQVILPEDADRVTYLLRIFDRAKQSGRFPYDKNIFNYKNFHQFAEMIESLVGENEEQPREQDISLRKWKAWVEKQGYEKAFGDKSFTLLRFALTGQKEEVVGTKVRKGYLTDFLPIWATKNLALPPHAKPVSLDIAAIAVSRLTTGTSLCVQNPVTAEQTYLARGPLYALFVKGEFFALSTVNWGEFMNLKNQALGIPSPALAYFLAKVLASVDIDATGKRIIQRFIEKGLESYQDTLPPRAAEIMRSVL